MCPECRGAFRVREGVRQVKVACPACSTRLTVDPGRKRFEAFHILADSGISKIDFRQEGSVEVSEEVLSELKRQRAAETSWDVDGPSEVAVKSGGVGLMTVVLCCLAFLAVIGGGVFVMSGNGDDRSAMVQNHARRMAPVEIPEDEVLPEIKPRSFEDLNFKQLVDESDELLGRICEVDSIEGLLPLAYPSPGLAERMEAYYARQPMGFDSIRGLIKDSLRRYKNGCELVVEFQDYSTRSLMLVWEDDEVFFDWDAWVQWSEMTAREFERSQPTEPVAVRAHCSRDTYYNRGFSDDGKWSSYRIRFGDEDLDFPAYCKKGSELDERLKSLMYRQRAQVLLKIRYPAGGNEHRQILIEDLVWENWSQAARTH